MKIKPVMVERTISLPKTVADWAEELASRHGHGMDVSAYFSDLIRREKARDNGQILSAKDKKNDLSPIGLQMACDQIVRVIETAAQRARNAKKKS